jgi:hypothetical protein
MSCYSDPASGGRTGEREAATSDQPPTPATAGRAPRCLRLVERTSGVKIRPPERCANEALPGSALCAHHLGEVTS